jgi:hypothetical protein
MVAQQVSAFPSDDRTSGSAAAVKAETVADDREGVQIDSLAFQPDPSELFASDGQPEHPVVGTVLARRRLMATVRRRAVPIVMTVVILVTGMLFEFFWLPVVHHYPHWFTQADLWGIFRGAHYVGWGFLGGVYTPGTGIVAFPGLPILLAPVAMLSGSLNLSESTNPIVLAHPTAIILLLPVVLLLGSTVLFAIDALAEELGVSRGRRAWLCIAAAVLVWPLVALWGHPEDALVMTFALCAMRAMLRGRWVRVGWLFGVALLMQPLIALVLPLFLVASPAGQRLRFALRCAALSVATVGVAFLGNASETYLALVKEPGEPSLNHPTPWLAFAPRVKDPLTATHQGTAPAFGPGGGHFVTAPSAVHHAVLVSGGVGRTLDVVLALVIALYAWRRPPSPLRLLWLAGAILASRCFFEAVMTPYYLTPPLLLLLVLTARHDWRRFMVATVVALAVSRFAYLRLGEWNWWLPVVVGLGVVLALAYPSDPGRRPGPDEVDAPMPGHVDVPVLTSA